MKKRKLLLSVLLVAVMGIMTSTAMAAPFTSLEQDGWTEIGPNNYSGRARAVIFDKFNDGVMYMGTVGGLYVSVNYGKNWQEVVLDGNVQNVTALAQADDGTIYVGTGEGYYLSTLHNEDPTGHSNHVSGKIGSGVFKLTGSFDKNWTANLASDEAKYAYVNQNISKQFSLLEKTKVTDKYNVYDPWAFVNTMAYYDGTLYIGTKNGGLWYSNDAGNTLNNIQLEGISELEIMDIAVSDGGRIAVSYDNVGGCVAINKDGSKNEFIPVFNTEATSDNPYSARGIGRIKLAFAHVNPNNLYIYAAINLKGTLNASYDDNYNGFLYGVYRPADTVNGISGISSINASDWSCITTPSMSGIQGTSLNYGMSIYIDDRSGEDIVYLGGDNLVYGRDYNGVGKYSFSSLTSNLTEDTVGMNVGVNINNILPMPNPKDAYDSLFMFVTSDAGAFRYYYDTVLTVLKWWPSVVGTNNLQTYKVTATADGSVLAASQSNAVVYIHTAGDTIKRGMKIWSINNPDYPMFSNITSNPYQNGRFSNNTFSASAVHASAMYRTSPSIRKPVLLARPGTNVTRTYGRNGDFEAIDDQTWTYGNSVPQTLMSANASNNVFYDPFNTPMAFWESFDFNGTIDSVELELNNNTAIHPVNGAPFLCTNGSRISEGDSVLVRSDNLGYPFFHVITASDTNSIAETVRNSSEFFGRDTQGEGFLFEKDSTLKLMVPQKVQARTLVATNTGAFICGKILDFSKSIDTAAASFGNLTWVKIYHTGTATPETPESESDLKTMNKRIHAVALSQDGSAAFLAVDIFSSFSSYDETQLVRVSGLNDVDINDDRTFIGIPNDTSVFTIETIATFNRQISSIVCDPKNSNNMILTFEGINSTDANVMQTTNAKAALVDFTDISLNKDRSGNTVSTKKPVFTALYESVGNSGRIYVGSDDGIYYRSGSSWTAETDVPNVAVYDLWQQTKKLPRWEFFNYTGENSESVVFESTSNTGVMYAATYGKGLLVNKTYLDDSELPSVSIEEISAEKMQDVLRIYPNPASTQAAIAYTLGNSSDVQLKMTDLSGREVSVFNCGRQSKGNHTQIVDVQNLQRGVYVIQMITKHSTKSAKLIVK